MIPLFHDLDGEAVLVFGGGTVGARKTRRFADEARVVVISPEFDDAIVDRGIDDGNVNLVRAAPKPDDAAAWIDRMSPALVVAATDDAALNAAVEAAALDADLLVNRTDRAGDRDPRSVVVPATVTDGSVRVAVSSGAQSPALSKALRERIEAEIDGAGAMADLSGTLRKTLRDRNVAPEDRRAAIRAVVRSDRVWKALQEGGSKGSQEAESVIEEVLEE